MITEDQGPSPQATPHPGTVAGRAPRWPCGCPGRGTRAISDGEDLLFTIESWARSGDRLQDALYDKVSVAREMQLHMWVSACEQVARMSGGRQDGAVRVVTERWSG